MPHDPTKTHISRTWHTIDALSKSKAQVLNVRHALLHLLNKQEYHQSVGEIINSSQQPKFYTLSTYEI